MSKTLEQFEQYLDKMKKYEHINTLLYWDMRTCAPKLGQAGHIDALTYFSTESFAMSTSDELYGMLETLKTPEEFAQLSDTMKFIVTRMQRDMEKDRRIPKDRYKVMVREQAESGNAWEDAKNASDFSIFAPHLEKMIALTKEMAGYTDPGKEVYDVLLDKYEEGMDSATIDRLFGELKEALIPLVKKILDAMGTSTKNKQITFDDIIQVTSDYFKIKKEEFFTKKRTQNIAYPRQIAMYLCREMADFSYPRIGEFFGGRDHTTVIHAYEKIVKKIKEDPNCEKTITYLVDKLKQ